MIFKNLFCIIKCTIITLYTPPPPAHGSCVCHLPRSPLIYSTVWEVTQNLYAIKDNGKDRGYGSITPLPYQVTAHTQSIRGIKRATRYTGLSTRTDSIIRRKDGG